MSDEKNEINGTSGNDQLTGTSGADFIKPRDGDDLVQAGDGDDWVNAFENEEGERRYYTTEGTLEVYGGKGNDLIGGKDGDDIIYGEEGDDRVWSKDGSDQIFGGDGDDYLSSGAGNDTLSGGTGDDKLYGGEGDDNLEGGHGDDYLSSGAGDDTLSGGAGEDDLYGGDGDDQLDGGDGNDYLNGGYDAGSDTLIGGSGDDRLIGNGGNDTLSGGTGDDKLYGGEGDDNLEGGHGDDYLSSGNGQDVLRGGSGNDTLNAYLKTRRKELYGEDGDDTLWGGDSDDILEGGNGADDLYGYEGADTLSGGTGDDKLYGGEGDDRLDGGLGFDYLRGGSGDDTYIINSRTFDLYDSGGNDNAIVKIDFAKIPSFIENVTYAEGVQPLPYWIDALLDSYSPSYSALLGQNKIFYYSFPQSISDYDTREEHALGYRQVDISQQTQVLTLLSHVEEIIDVTFEFTSNPDQPNVFSFAYNQQSGSGGYAQYPDKESYGSDVFLNDASYNSTLRPGTYGANVLTHEVGHALGLKHPFRTADVSGDIAGPPYLTGSEDHARWAMMSYTESSAEYKLSFSPLDIAALQYIYGVNPDSRSGDDIYKYSASQANFIWDGSGTDTIDASGSTQKVTIYLKPGYWGYKGSAKAEKITSSGQITVNFGTVIENLIGSRYDDKLVGNSADNSISGGSGDDVLYGGDGDDKFDRESKSGDDTFYGGNGNDQYYFTTSYDGGSDTIIEEIGEGNDTVHVDNTFSLEEIANVENLYSYSNVSTDMDLTGNELNNWIAPSKGDCVIDGKAGIDTVYYFADTQNECVVFTEDDILKVTKSNGSTDSLFNCEYIKFSDATLKISELQLGPTITEFSPTKNATNAKLSSNIVLVFSSAISLGSGQIRLRKTGSPSEEVIVYDAATSMELSVDGNTLTIDPSGNLDALSTYEVNLDVGSIVDSNNNKFRQQDQYIFKTEAGIKLELTGSTTASEIRNSDEIVLTFTKPFVAGQGLITVTDTSSNAVTEFNPASGQNITIDGKSLTITLSSSLSNSTTFVVELKPGSIDDSSETEFAEAKLLLGSTSNDTISISDGYKIISGGEGNDTVTLENDLGDYLVSKNPESGLVLITDKLGNEIGLVSSDIETLSFRDDSVVVADIAYWGEFSEVSEKSIAPVYRFYNTRDNAFFYTNNADEKDLVIANSSIDKNNVDEWPYVYQGATFEAAHSYQNSSQITPLYRFYNYETGHHFFTVSKEEAEFVNGKIESGEWPFNYEGTTFNVYANDPNPSSEGEEIAVHRFYSPELNRHFYTADESEVESIQLTGQWNYEGIGFWGELLG